MGQRFEWRRIRVAKIDLKKEYKGKGKKIKCDLIVWGSLKELG